MRNDRLRAAALGITLGLALTVAGTAAAADGTLEKVKKAGVLVIGYRETARPFSFKDEQGQPAGYSVDLCRRIAAGVQKSLGLAKLDLRFVPVTAANRVESVAKGAVDIECGSTTMSLSRQEQVDFTSMTFVDGGSLLVVDGLGIRAVPDLKGKRVAVIPGTTTAPALEAVLQRAQVQTTVVPVKTHEEGLAALEKGTADAYASDRTILIGIGRRAAKPERYALADEIFSYEPHGFMVRRNDSAFRLVANRALAGLYRSGDIAEIYRKWFGDMGAPGAALRAMYLLHGLPE
ncbi:MAG TPA: amino acid ABC transporter substrate-binding protein [Methylomirabilota bacterium]|nr:amino acid ABC transporter substrate-binding protein [Methylomirabilota bacterium]